MRKARLRRFTEFSPENIEFIYPTKSDRGYDKEKLLKNTKIGSNIGIALGSLSGMGLGSLLGSRLAGDKEKQIREYLIENPDKTKEVAEFIFNKKKDKYKSVGRVSGAILGSIGGYLAGNSLGKILTKIN